MNSKDIRWRQRFENYTKALGQLTEFVEKPELNKFEVQGLIQCFEYTFELAWKTAKDYLEEQGFTVRKPSSDNSNSISGWVNTRWSCLD